MLCPAEMKPVSRKAKETWNPLIFRGSSRTG
jgi:hypothetical protein